ncbi:unnamed protein product [Peniophora sp. CBMAI 1063]|nr:unnamed protein product [Peniophora sp. CBMAI 1063]
MARYEGSTLGLIRAYWLATVVCMGGFLFGYDSGVAGGVLTFPSFENDFRFTPKQATRTSSLSVSLQQGGAFVSCLLVWPLTRRYGRKWPLVISSFVFCIGVIIDTINTHSLPAFYVGRIVAGLGLGAATVIIPAYNSEMAPKELRGQVGCFFQLFYTLGILISYWIDYGVAKHIPGKTAEWQIPIGLQLVPAAAIGFGALTLTESTRWLTAAGRHEEAWRSLVWIRASDAPEVEAEMQEIREGVERELKAQEGFRLTELLEIRNGNFRLVATAFLMFTAQQSTGATAFAYYAPQYFKLLAGGSSNQQLLLTGIFGAVKVVACAFFVFVLSNFLGRRKPLIFGAALMAILHFIAGAITKTHPPAATGSPSSANIATVVMIYLFVVVYNMSWGPLPWPYVSEIFPARIRDAGVAVGVASQWLFSFVYTLSNAYMIASMGWGVFILWGGLNLIIAIASYFFIVETNNLSLERINEINRVPTPTSYRDDHLHPKDDDDIITKKRSSTPSEV